MDTLHRDRAGEEIFAEVGDVQADRGDDAKAGNHNATHGTAFYGLGGGVLLACNLLFDERDDLPQRFELLVLRVGVKR